MSPTNPRAPTRDQLQREVRLAVGQAAPLACPPQRASGRRRRGRGSRGPTAHQKSSTSRMQQLDAALVELLHREDAEAELADRAPAHGVERPDPEERRPGDGRCRIGRRLRSERSGRAARPCTFPVGDVCGRLRSPCALRPENTCPPSDPLLIECHAEHGRQVAAGGRGRHAFGDEPAGHHDRAEERALPCRARSPRERRPGCRRSRRRRVRYRREPGGEPCVANRGRAQVHTPRRPAAPAPITATQDSLIRPATLRGRAAGRRSARRA